MTENFSLKIEKIISLPITIETHAVSINWNEDLWVLINLTATKETFIYRLNASLNFEKIVSLPFLSTSATICKNKLFIIGADFKGKPVLISINKFGKILTNHTLEFTPTIWPVIAYSNKLFIAWQENETEIERGNFNMETNKIEKLKPISISNPPAIFCALKETVFATISEKTETRLINLISDEIIKLDISQQITIGKTIETIFYGWMENNTVCLKFLKKNKQINFPIKNASLGKLKAISGNLATFWLQNRQMQMSDEYQWKSIIIQEKTSVFEIEGFIFTVGSWNNRIVLVQNSRIILLKNTNPAITF